MDHACLCHVPRAKAVPPAVGAGGLVEPGLHLCVIMKGGQIHKNTL